MLQLCSEKETMDAVGDLCVRLDGTQIDTDSPASAESDDQSKYCVGIYLIQYCMNIVLVKPLHLFLNGQILQIIRKLLKHLKSRYCTMNKNKSR